MEGDTGGETGAGRDNEQREEKEGEISGRTEEKIRGGRRESKERPEKTSNGRKKQKTEREEEMMTVGEQHGKSRQSSNPPSQPHGH